MKIAISGTDGFVGSSLSNYLEKKKIKVIKLQKKKEKKTICWKLGENLPAQVYKCNIFIHCAFDKKSLNKKQNLKKNNNFIGLKKILDQINNKKKYFFFISSQTSNKNILSNYGKLKFFSENLIKKYQNKKNIIITPGIIYSRNQSTVINYLKKIIKIKIFFYFSKKKNIYPIGIEDFCECIYKIIKLKKIEKKYYLATQKSLSLVDFVKYICRDNNISFPLFIYISKRILIFFAIILDFFKISDLSLVERIKSIDQMPLIKSDQSIKKIKHIFLKKFI